MKYSNFEECRLDINSVETNEDLQKLITGLKEDHEHNKEVFSQNQVAEMIHLLSMKAIEIPHEEGDSNG